jgi:hypothetical protein
VIIQEFRDIIDFVVDDDPTIKYNISITMLRVHSKRLFLPIISLLVLGNFLDGIFL